MMRWLLEIEKEKDFEDQVVEFCARTTNNSFGDFVSFFSERNVKVRCLNKLVQGRTKAAGYHSAANVDEISKRINDKVNAEIANFAATFEAAFDAGALDANAVAAQAGNNERDSRQRSGQTHLFPRSGQGRKYAGRGRRTQALRELWQAPQAAQREVLGTGRQ